MWDVLIIAADCKAVAADLRARAAAAWPSSTWHSVDDTTVLFTDGAWKPSRGGWGLLLSQGAHDVDGGRVTSDDVLRLATGDSCALQRVVPPAAFLWHTPGGGMVAATDYLGLRHVYVRETAPWCAVSTSSTLLSMLAPTSVDADAVSLLAMTGSLLGDRTPYRGVRKLRPGERMEVSRRESSSTTRPAWPTAPWVARGTPGASGAACVRVATGAAVSAFPDLELELSGGLDSRILLAAAGSAWRARKAVTVGAPEDPDVAVASHIAAQAGVEHRVVPPASPADADDGLLLAAVAGASRRQDHSGNPLARLVLDQGERAMGTPLDGRVSGQGGEYARGFYYAGQRAGASTRRHAAERLTRWRIIANDRTDASLLTPEFAAYAEDAAVRHIVDSLMSDSTVWLTATDEYYLRERMQRWVGLDYSVGITERIILAPFFHPAFLSWAASVAPAAKRGSKALAQTLMHLDRDLAGFPLAGGMAPETLCGAGLPARLLRARRDLYKVIAKARQRASRRTRPPISTSAFAERVVLAWRRDPDQISDLAAHPMVRTDALEQVLTGGRRLDATSVGMLITLRGLDQALKRQVPFER